MERLREIIRNNSGTVIVVALFALLVAVVVIISFGPEEIANRARSLGITVGIATLAIGLFKDSFAREEKNFHTALVNVGDKDSTVRSLAIGMLKTYLASGRRNSVYTLLGNRLMVDRPRIVAEGLANNLAKEDDEYVGEVCIRALLDADASWHPIILTALCDNNRALWKQRNRDSAKAYSDSLRDDNGDRDIAQSKAQKEAYSFEAPLSLTRKAIVGFLRGCDLRVMVTSDGTAKQEIIREFRKECESNRKKHAVLVVRAESDSETWTIAGFSNAGYFKVQGVSGPGDELCEELKKKHVNESRVLQMATSRLGRAPSIGPDVRAEVLKGIHLDYADFTRADLSGCDFTGATLTHVNFKQANLARAKFDRAVILNSYFSETNIDEASFKGAVFGCCHFHKLTLGEPGTRPMPDAMNEAFFVVGNKYTENIGGWDLRLMSVSATSELVDEGRSLTVVALVGADLHIRIFDASGEQVVDKAESELVAGAKLTALKQRLNPLPGESSLSRRDKQEIIADATSIAGHAHIGGAKQNVEWRFKAEKELKPFRNKSIYLTYEFDWQTIWKPKEPTGLDDNGKACFAAAQHSALSKEVIDMSFRYTDEPKGQEEKIIKREYSSDLHDGDYIVKHRLDISSAHMWYVAGQRTLEGDEHRWEGVYWNLSDPKEHDRGPRASQSSAAAESALGEAG